jgi:hypothetical protein
LRIYAGLDGWTVDSYALKSPNATYGHIYTSQTNVNFEAWFSYYISDASNPDTTTYLEAGLRPSGFSGLRIRFFLDRMELVESSTLDTNNDAYSAGQTWYDVFVRWTE